MSNVSQFLGWTGLGAALLLGWTAYHGESATSVVVGALQTGQIGGATRAPHTDFATAGGSLWKSGASSLVTAVPVVGGTIAAATGLSDTTVTGNTAGTDIGEALGLSSKAAHTDTPNTPGGILGGALSAIASMFGGI